MKPDKREEYGAPYNDYHRLAHWARGMHDYWVANITSGLQVVVKFAGISLDINHNGSSEAPEVTTFVRDISKDELPPALVDAFEDVGFDIITWADEWVMERNVKLR